jgi:hypothetical protein
MGLLSGNVAITGDKQLDRRLRALEPKVAKKYARTALRDALKPTAAAVKSAAPRGSGALAGQIKVRAAKRSRRGIAMKIQLGDDQAKTETAAAQRAKRRWPFYAAIREFKGRGEGYMGDTFKARESAIRADAMNRLRAAVGLAASSD